MKLLPILLFPLACGGEQITSSCPWKGVAINSLERRSFNSCRLDNQQAKMTFEYSPAGDVYWFHYLTTISIDIEVKGELDASRVVEKEIVLRTINGSGETSLNGYYTAKFSGQVIVEEGDEPNINVCIKSEIGVAGQKDPSVMTFQADVICN